jgi:xanthine dehydrogenase accessory factor
VIATPSHRFDYAVLRRALTSGWAPRYVGLIASKKKATGFLQDLKAELGENADLKSLYMPIGVDTGGSSAAEIAVSIIAEIQAVRYGRTGLRHLRLEALAQ